MIYIIYTVLAFLIVAGSYAHGRGDDLDGDPDKSWYESKGVYIIVQLVAFYFSAQYLATWKEALASLLCVSFSWFVIRNSTEASATLDYIDDVIAASKKRLLTAHIDSTAICVVATLGAIWGLSFSWSFAYWLIPVFIGHGLCFVVPVVLGRGWKTEKEREKKRKLTEIFGVGLYSAAATLNLFALITNVYF